MRKLALALALALLGGAFTAVPAAAWHVGSAGCEVDPIPTLKVKRDGPYLDPFYIYTFRHTGYRKTPPVCRSTVTVPDAKWADGTVFTVTQTGQQATRGQTIGVPLRGPAGEYCFTGTWSNSDEVEEWCVTKAVAFTKATTVRLWLQKGKDGNPRALVRTLPRPGCTWTTPLLYSQPYSLAIAKRISPIKQKLKVWRADRPGFYPRPDRSYQTPEWKAGQGVVCPRAVTPA
jgi:hypothetical protein